MTKVRKSERIIKETERENKTYKHQAYFQSGRSRSACRDKKAEYDRKRKNGTECRKECTPSCGAGGARDREKHGAGYLTQTNRLFLIRFSLAMCESQRLEIPIRKIICFMHDSCIHFSCFAIRAPHEIERMRDRKSIYIVK